jgi:imidazole glycerol-phosphate synthase subunit HisF
MGWKLLKKRIIPVELLYKGRLVKTVKFSGFRDVGDPIKSSQVYSDQDADELILLNIDRDNRSAQETAKYLRNITERCFMPIAVGGGVRNIEDAQLLFDSGADKVIVNTESYSDKSLLASIISRWGGQSLVVSIDVHRISSQQYVAKSECGKKVEKVELVSHVQSMNDLGVGEIMINSIDNDGVMEGYDLSLIRLMLEICNMPLIVCGGAGNFSDLKDSFELGVSAAACGSLFNFGDNNPLRAKSFLKNYNIPLKKI